MHSRLGARLAVLACSLLSAFCDPVGKSPAPSPSLRSFPDRDDRLTQIVISKSKILVGDARVPVVELGADREALAEHGLDRKYKRAGPSDLLIVPLANQLKGAGATSQDANLPKGRSEAMVTADADTPCRVLIEVLYTLGQSGYARYHLMVLDRAPKPGRQVLQQPPKAATGETPAPGLAGGRLVLRISKRGYALRAGGQMLAGCELETGDTAGLSQCAKRVKAANPDETAIVIVAASATPYKVVIDAIDAVRAADRTPLFPDVTFGVDPM